MAGRIIICWLGIAIVAIAGDVRRLPPVARDPVPVITDGGMIVDETQATSATSATDAPAIAANDFSPNPLLTDAPDPNSLADNYAVYACKLPEPTQFPWVELGRTFYGTGITPPGVPLGDETVFGHYNPLRGEAYLYGDLRTGIASGRNAAARTDNLASRLNLDADWKLTDSERFHAFVGPLDNGGAFTRYEYVAGDLRFRNEVDFTPVTAFFEGDLGRMVGAARGETSRREIPVAAGLVPLMFQNGIGWKTRSRGSPPAFRPSIPIC